MNLSSPAFENNQPIPTKYTCQGDNINPRLIIEDVPPATKSLALIVDDPDAPTGDFVHWLVWNISPETKVIAEDSVLKDAMKGLTDFGTSGYGGPCPPTGMHRYQFKVYALDTKLELNAAARKKDLEQAMQGHIFEQAMLVGTYEKS